MAKLKTTTTGVSVDSFLDKVTDETQRADSYTLIELMKEITGCPPKMWGPSIIGFGDYHYKYASGHEGDCCLAAFSPRKGNLVLYIAWDLEDYAPMLAKLGKHKAGKCCLYIKRLDQIDFKVLRAMIEKAHAHLTGTITSDPKKPMTTAKKMKKT